MHSLTPADALMYARTLMFSVKPFDEYTRYNRDFLVSFFPIGPSMQRAICR